MNNNSNFLTFKSDNPPGIYLVTGQIGSGKSVFSKSMFDSVIEAGVGCAGIISQGVFDAQGQKVAICMLDVVSQEKHRFAKKVMLNDSPCDKMRMGQWCIDEAVLVWGNDCLKKIVKTNVLFLDELGPLEIWRQMGLLHGLALLEQKAVFDYAFVVVRPSLVDEMKDRFDVVRVIELDK